MSWVNDITNIQQKISLDNAMRRSGVNDLLRNANNHMDSVIKERNSKRKASKNEKVSSSNVQNDALDNYKKKIGAKIENTKSLIDTYRLNSVNQERLRELVDLRGEEHKKLLAENDGIISNLYTNKRRVEYQTPELATLGNYRIVIILVYYLTMILVLINKYMVTNKIHLNFKTAIAIILYLLLPLVLDNIVVRSYDIINTINRVFTEKSPKNVYKNL